MKLSTYDVVVVGAGPAGSMVASVVAESGLKTLLCEEHSMVGRPCHCTGKLSAHAFKEFELPKDSILNSVKAATIYSPGGSKLSIRRGTVDSHILDRELFDSRLSDRACTLGAELSLRTRIYDLSRESERYVILKGKKDGSPIRFRSKIIVDAEGATPVLPRIVGLQSGRELLLGIQYELSGLQIESPDSVELYLGREIAPGFFAWIVPLSEGRARVGLCARRSMVTLPLRQYMERFVRFLIDCGRLKDFRVERTLAGVEPAEHYMTPSYTDNFMVVGDSAGHVKSTSGGGLYFGLKAAKLAGETAVECLERGDASRQTLRSYEDKWMGSFVKELKATLILRRVLNNLTDDEVDRLIRKMSEDEIKRIIERYGDTAFQSRIIRPIIPKLLKGSLRDLGDISLLVRIFMEGISALLT
ncbi:MAG: geranylgeranyl reductase family protein [Candidatus Bathyarchaeia archaeon]